MEKHKRTARRAQESSAETQIYVAHMLCISDKDMQTLKEDYASYFNNNSGAYVTQCQPLEGNLPSVRCRFMRTADYYHWRGASVSLGVAEYKSNRRKRFEEFPDREIMGVEIVGTQDCLDKRIREFRDASRKRGARVHLIHKGPCNGTFYGNNPT